MTTFHYDPEAPPDPDEWLGLDEDERIDAVQAYHARAGVALPNAHAHAAVHVIVENQIALEDPLAVPRKARHLMAAGLDRHEAIHAIGSVLMERMRLAARRARPPADPNKAYLRALARLTAKTWLRSG